MKGRFSTLDIGVIVKELRRFLGMRVVNVYDIDNKTYLIRIVRPDAKTVILLESGIRLHSTDFDWPKNPAPSGFSMKMRKHLKGRRFEKIEQLGVDRIVDMQFGSGEAAYHVILELYDKGNIVLTDHEYRILNILRPRTDNSQDVRFAVHELYPITVAKHHEVPTEESLLQIIQSAKEGDTLKRALVPHLDYGPAVLEHCLLEAGISDSVQIGKGFDITTDMSRILTAIEMAETLMTSLLSRPCKGYIIQRVDKRPNPKDGEATSLATYDEYHPFLFRQLAQKSNIEFEMFDKAADEFYSKLESQKLDVRVLQQERAALKKLDNVKKDHELRINKLQKEQESDITRGQLIEINLELVDKAILVVRSALANQIDWTEIGQLVKEAQATGDPVARAIAGLKLDTNHITMLLQDPYQREEEEKGVTHLKPQKVDIDLGLSAYANSRKFFDKKRQAANKEQKTVEASGKALKSAEKKTKETLKDMATVASINKTRKTYWFEKFLWFISSENYLVIGGRDQQQNELIVKRYLKPGDLYVHADLHGASSVVVKNPTAGDPVPPKTLNEAGTMAICNSAAWNSRVITSAWWVNYDQVSKTAPSGEYLTTGSFMIRGKKNYLPPSYLIYGFGFLFRLEDGSIARHAGERKVRALDDEVSSTSLMSDTESMQTVDEDEENAQSSDSDDKEDSPAPSGDDDKELSNHHGSEQASKSDEDSDNEEGEDCDEDSGSEDPKSNGEADVKKMTTEDVSTGVQFPDTTINLTHIKGDKYELQRLSSVASSCSSATDEVNAIYLGDDKPFIFGEKTANRATGRLSAKQRREMRKARKVDTSQKSVAEEAGSGSIPQQEQQSPAARDLSSNTAEDCDPEARLRADSGGVKSQQQQQQTAKRGQKSKLKKIKEKYGDQDEEERELKMKILASSGADQAERKKKGKKGKDNSAAKNVKQGGRPQSAKGTIKTDQEITKPTGFVKQDAPDEGSDGEQDVQDDDTQQLDDLRLINSLTGQPHPDDELLYAVPCCAPYNSLINYKYKVKLLPGTSKKGKATKTALNMFQHDRSATSWEKDLLRIMKDVDLSRNLPGKVKVAAPNLHKK